MSDEERDHIGRLLKEAARKDRGYASFFDWPDRDQKEVGVVLSLFEALHQNERSLYSGLRARGQGNDPPDCEAVDPSGRRMGIEVTELVDSGAIARHKGGHTYETAAWNREKFFTFLRQLIVTKDRPAHLKGGPYAVYWLVIHCDEPELSCERVTAFLSDVEATMTNLIDEVFLVMSYVPGKSSHPYFRVPLARVA